MMTDLPPAIELFWDLAHHMMTAAFLLLEDSSVHARLLNDMMATTVYYDYCGSMSQCGLTFQWNSAMHTRAYQLQTDLFGIAFVSYL